MSLEDTVNRQLRGEPPEPPKLSEERRRQAEWERYYTDSKRAESQRILDSLVEAFKRDIPFAQKMMAQADSLILPELTDFQHSLMGKYKTVALEGGVSYETQIPEVKRLSAYASFDFDVRKFSFGSFYYRLIWGNMYPTQYYTRKPLFREEEQWEKGDYADFQVRMILDHNGKDFGFVGGHGLNQTTSFGAHIVEWMKRPEILKQGLRAALLATTITKFDRKIEIDNSGWSQQRDGMR